MSSDKKARIRRQKIKGNFTFSLLMLNEFKIFKVHKFNTWNTNLLLKLCSYKINLLHFKCAFFKCAFFTFFKIMVGGIEKIHILVDIKEKFYNLFKIIFLFIFSHLYLYDKFSCLDHCLSSQSYILPLVKRIEITEK